MLLVNPLLNESHSISGYISGLEYEIKPLVSMANPTSLMDALKVAKAYGTFFRALSRSIPLGTPSFQSFPKLLRLFISGAAPVSI